MRTRRIIILVLLVIIIAPVIAILVFAAQFNPNRYAPALIAAVQTSTGRQLSLGSPIKLAFSLTPTIEASDISLANPPGYADADFMTFQQVDAQIALLPLLSHQVDIRRLVLIGPQITLEKNAAGIGNWDFGTQTPAQSPGAPGSGNGGEPSGYKIALELVEVQNALLTFKDAHGVQTGALTVPELTGAAASPSAPLKLAAQAAYNGAPFTLNGEVGPVERFSGIGSGPWPVDLTLAGAGATAAVQGGIAEPRSAKGYNLTIQGNIPALEGLQPFVPVPLLSKIRLPPIHNINFTTHVTDQGTVVPAITNLSIKAGASDLSGLRAGLALTSLDIEMPSLGQAVTLNANGTMGSVPLTVSGNIGAPNALLNPAWLPADDQPSAGNFPVSLQAQAGDAKFGIAGGIATPLNYAGVALALNAAVPDLSQLSPLAGTALPAWKNITMQGTLIDPGGLGLAKAVGLDGLIVTMDNAAFGGDASLYFGNPPRLQMALKSQSINLDALLSAMPAKPLPASTTPSRTAATAGGYVVSTAKLPLGALKAVNADIQLAADTLVFNRTVYSAIQGHAVLTNGVLTINPLTALLPGGSVSATASLDASKEPAAAAVTVNAPALALGPFLKSLNLPDTAQGTMQATMNATGAGDSPHDIIASVNGQLGLAMVNGIIDGGVLNQLFGTALQTVNLPVSIIGAQGPVAVRCFGVRMDSSNGVGTIRTLTLDSSRLLVQGGGSVNFGNETLGVIIRPQVKVAGNNVTVPVQIGGTFANPTTSLAPLSAVEAAAKTAFGLPVSITQEVTGGNSVLTDILSTVGLGGSGDVCPAALSLARMGKPGPAPAALPPVGGIAPATISGPKNLLNSLFGK